MKVIGQHLFTEVVIGVLPLVVGGEKDIREMLAKEAVALGNAMLSCEEEKKTLEELFFQLIN